MTRNEYLKELEGYLITLPKEERDMAVQFYSEYFDEAGPDKEQATIDELGKPYNLAKSIIGGTSTYSKSEVYLKYRESKPMPQNTTGVFNSFRKPENTDKDHSGNLEQDFFSKDTEQDVMPGRAYKNAAQNGAGMEKMPGGFEQDVMPGRAGKDVMPNGTRQQGKQQGTPYEPWGAGQSGTPKEGMFDQYYQHGGQQTPPPSKPEKKSMEPWLIVVIVLLCVFLGIPALIVIAGALIAVLAIGVAAIACIVAAVVVLVMGIVSFFGSAAKGVMFIFTAILVAGVGLILLAPAILIYFKFLPWCVKSIGKLFKGKRAAV